MNKAYELLIEAEKKYEQSETVQAPSGEWNEYNVEYLQIQARWFGMEELANEIGSCEECEYFNITDNLILNCAKGQKPSCKEWYCADFIRKEET